MDRDAFCEELLRVMEQKVHWAWPAFTHGLVPRNLLHVHLEQEFATYIRDFPVLVGWAYVQCPVPEVRRDLAENLYEEETGGMVAGAPHPELFLRYPKGMGMDLGRFTQVTLLPHAKAYRQVLDDATQKQGWEVALAVTTLFLEGTAFERGELQTHAKRRPEPALHEHPLVRFYGLPEEDLALTRAHRKVEGTHRRAAWRSVLQHTSVERRPVVVTAMHAMLQHWLAYRDEVAQACGLRRGVDGDPELRAGLHTAASNLRADATSPARR